MIVFRYIIQMDRQRNCPVAMEFVNKLASLLDVITLKTEQKQKGIARWSENGAEFEIVNVKEFEEKVLGRYFRHSKMSSFVRQLNMYGFRKISRRTNQMVFVHPYFRKNQEDAYHLIKRKKHTIEDATKPDAFERIKDKAKELVDSGITEGDLLMMLVNFHSTTKTRCSDIKKHLDNICQFASAKKTREIKPVLQKIRNCLKDIHQADKKLQGSVEKHIDESFEKKGLPSTTEKIKSLRYASTPHMRDPQQLSPRVYEALSYPEIRSFQSISSYIN